MPSSTIAEDAATVALGDRDTSMASRTEYLTAETKTTFFFLILSGVQRWVLIRSISGTGYIVRIYTNCSYCRTDANTYITRYVHVIRRRRTSDNAYQVQLLYCAFSPRIEILSKGTDKTCFPRICLEATTDFWFQNTIRGLYT